MYLTTIPFSGFYNSLHDSALDDALDQMFSDRDTGCRVNQNLVQRAFDIVNWRKVHIEYAEEFCDAFAEKLGIKLKFSELRSPREYNFETDRIFAYMDETTLHGLRARVSDETLQEVIRERFTSRSGFISFYPNKLESWPPDMLQWDANHIGTLIEAAVRSEWPDYDHFQEHYLMEGAISNGHLDNMIYPGLERLCRIHEYLDQTRPKRKSQHVAAL